MPSKATVGIPPPLSPWRLTAALWGVARVPTMRTPPRARRHAAVEGGVAGEVTQRGMRSKAIVRLPMPLAPWRLTAVAWGAARVGPQRWCPPKPTVQLTPRGAPRHAGVEGGGGDMIQPWLRFAPRATPPPTFTLAPRPGALEGGVAGLVFRTWVLSNRTVPRTPMGAFISLIVV